MRCLRISFLVCICLFPALIFATDNSFRLDFDGDGRTDLALYREGSRTAGAPQPSLWFYASTATGETHYIQWGRSLDVPAPADYDNDGKTDVAIFRWWDLDYGDTSEWWIGQSAGGHTVIPGLELGYNKFSRNYFGDGRAEVGQLYQVDVSQNPGEHCFVSAYFVIDFAGVVLRKTVGDTCNVNPTPIPADYDGDGHSDLAVYTNRHFKLWVPPYAAGYTPPNYLHYMDVDTPTPGDFDGDGRADFAGVKNRDGRMIWRYRKSSTGEEIEVDFGFSTDKPVPGDYDGDGTTDIAIFRSGVWWIRNSGSGEIQTFQYGIPTDTPLAAPVIPFSPV